MLYLKAVSYCPNEWGLVQLARRFCFFKVLLLPLLAALFGAPFAAAAVNLFAINADGVKDVDNDGEWNFETQTYDYVCGTNGMNRTGVQLYADQYNCMHTQVGTRVPGYLLRKCHCYELRLGNQPETNQASLGLRFPYHGKQCLRSPNHDKK